MILRSIGARHGRRLLSTPIARTGLRRLTTEDGPKAPDAAATATPPRPADVAGSHVSRSRMKSVIRPVGSEVEQRYKADHNLSRPVEPRFLTLERLMAAQTHMGHHASLWNPANSRYIYGVRQGIHIISLETTAAHLRRAATVVEEVSYRGGLVLFVGTRRGQMEIVTEAAREAKACHLFTKWTPGSITNRDIILRDRLINVVNEHDQMLPGFDQHINESRPLLPDLVVCLNPLENYTMLYECGLGGIPTIGVIDTDADPSWVTYTIPANDDSLRSVALIASVLGQAGKKGQKRRLADATDGHVTWKTPNDISKFISGMSSRRGEILTSLIDKEIIGGLKVPEKAAASPEGLGAVEQEPRDEQDLVAEEYIDEEDELLKELEDSSVEMDAMSEVEKDILESFAKEKEAARVVSEGDIMAGVGVEKGVPEEGQSQAPEGVGAAEPAQEPIASEAGVAESITEEAQESAIPEELYQGIPPEGPSVTEAVPEAVVEEIIIEETKQEAKPRAEKKSAPAKEQQSAPEKPQQKEAPIEQEQTKKPGKDE